MRSQHESIRVGIQNDLDKMTHVIDAKMSNNLETYKKDMNMHKEDLTSKINESKRQVLEEIIPVTRKQEEGINQLRNLLSTHDDRIVSMEDQLYKQTSFTSPQIHVTCTGGSSNLLDINTPKFHGRTQNPKEFLAKLKRFYDKQSLHQRQADSKEYLKDVIEMSMESHAAKWYNLVKEEIHSWTDFESMFLNRYWNREIQRGIKQRIEVETYRPGGSLTRTEYYTERVLILRAVTPTLSEEEIVTIMAEHFSDLIQDSRRVQNINNVNSFELLLQKEDLKDAHRRSKNHEGVRHESTQQRTSHTNTRIPNSPPRNSQPYKHQGYQQRPMQSYQHNGYNNYKRDFQNRPENRNNQHPYQRSNNYHERRNDSRDVNRQYPTREQAQVCHTVVERREVPNQNSVSLSNSQSNNSTLN